MRDSFALISVYDKTGIGQLAQTFQKLGIKIIATQGTAQFLKTKNVAVALIDSIAGNQELFDGRMKTISFQIASGILFDRGNKSHFREARQFNIPPIDFVICNFYPFWKNQSMEMIDIGGPTMVRAAAKNYHHVTVVVDPHDYQMVTDELNYQSQTTLSTRLRLAAKAFSYVSDYDSNINNFFQSAVKNGELTHTIYMDKGRILRYGENLHQKGFFFQNPKNNDQLSLGRFKILQGKDPSFNNFLDITAGIEAISLIGDQKPACVIIKHTNPCGAAEGLDIEDEFKKAWFDGDPLAAFGGTVVFNREVSEKLAKTMLSGHKFFEVVVAPKFNIKALSAFSQKSRLQLWENPALAKPRLVSYEDVKKVRGGFLIQDGDIYQLKQSDLRIVTKKKPTKKQIEDLLFAWKIAQICKSNAVVAVKNKILISSGVGQQDRKRCCQLCVSKSLKPLKGAVAATDGFFPFRDGPDILIKAGIKAIIQPGGSIRDGEVIDACNEKGVTMIFTNVRAFRH